MFNFISRNQVKSLLLFVPLLGLFVLSACEKDDLELYREVIGSWTWSSSQRNYDGAYMIQCGDPASYQLQLTNRGLFNNSTYCLQGSPAEGSYRYEKIQTGKILVLSSSDKTDTLIVSSVGDNHLTLRQSMGSYCWIHRFVRE